MMGHLQQVVSDSKSPAQSGAALSLQENLFPQVSGVPTQSQSASVSNLSGEGSHAGILLPDITRNKHQGNPQSEAANVRVAPMKNSMRELIYSAIAASENGLTSKELGGLLNKPIHTFSGRISELKTDGRIEVTSAVREDAAVLRAKGKI